MKEQIQQEDYMAEKLKIQYRDFYDVPRVFVTSYRDRHYLFDCPFNDELDDYPNAFDVFLIHPLSDNELKGSWQHLRDKAIRFLGQVPVKAVRFDKTLRNEIDADVLNQLSE